MAIGLEVRGRPARPDPTFVSAQAGSSMISTSHPAATEAGVTALRAGGSAVDAYVAAAAVQTVVEPTMTSLAGGFSIKVFDPATGASRSVAGVGALPAGEDGDLPPGDVLSGRTIVAPGWVRGAHSAWRQWGRLPWADVLADALSCAREGFVVDQQLWGYMFEYRAAMGRHPAGREVWFPDGAMVCVGDLLRQPALARTIEQLAEQGPDFFYRGDFARNYVDVAREAGGRLTLDDLEACAEQSGTPTAVPSTPLADGSELQGAGGLYALALNLAAVGGLFDRALPSEDAETLYLQLRIVEECWHAGLALGERDFGRVDDESTLFEAMVDAVSPAAAEALWPTVKDGTPRPFDGMNLNTNGIVVIDESGMVAHGTHSTSSIPFGVGYMVDGVVVPKAMYHFSRPQVALPFGLDTSFLALRDGKPLFTAASPSISLFQNLFQNGCNVLGWQIDVGESVGRPRFGASHFPSTAPMVESSMGDQIVDEVERRGLPVTRVSPFEPELGSCHAIHVLADGTLDGAADPRRLGRAAGY
jgi:gamma-glutamyltranspeptidase/glutathione hydrolase